MVGFWLIVKVTITVKYICLDDYYLSSLARGNGRGSDGAHRALFLVQS